MAPMRDLRTGGWALVVSDMDVPRLDRDRLRKRLRSAVGMMRQSATPVRHDQPEIGGWALNNRVLSGCFRRTVLRRGNEPLPKRAQLRRLGNALRRYQVEAGIRRQ